MADECIHGFDDGMCAVCFPTAEPAVATRSRTVRPKLSRLSDPVRQAGAAAAPSQRATLPPAEEARPFDVANSRIFHVTHVDNLAGILGAGAVLADGSGARPTVDIAAPAAREFRRATSIPGLERTVADYVPFFLTSDAHLWRTLRDGRPDVRLAANAHERPAADHILVIGTVGKAFGAQGGTPGSVVVTDRDAAVAGGEVEIEQEEIERLVRRLNRSGQEAALGGAEFLVHGSYPIERVAYIGVATEKVRDRVRAALKAVGAKPKILVYPRWFRDEETAE
ncbi:DarT ssDNA thymidine ADP-ribosyltransferase family protein [Agromyces seonyuensis]|uniref:DUF4433 domain-containing protein n=1 Tax=Agromyces seonyuensis TaxID=2662446 RepID=A0A6I4NZV3_9MICO|nr:DarT ssDNA thymidine ADP-ribosyltransferase family protein [Agromyces seonyuensis]MWB99873.1 DUF4433 domain-containing protein [Agromyces seonyuensis]